VADAVIEAGNSNGLFHIPSHFVVTSSARHWFRLMPSNMCSGF